MAVFGKGRYTVRQAVGAADVQAAQRLRWLAFRPTAQGGGVDTDRFDPLCRHVLIEERDGGRLVCTFRFMLFDRGRTISHSYSAQFYGLAGLGDYPGRMIELGRFCIHPTCHDPDILRVAWAAVTRVIEDEAVDLLFGCSSFKGTETRDYLDAFAVLKARHLAPKRWRPAIKAPTVFRFAARLRRKPDPRAAMLSMPPLLRTYLMMGGWVSDHAVVDTDLNTLHVFTGLEIGAIPPARVRLLRAVAAEAVTM